MGGALDHLVLDRAGGGISVRLMVSPTRIHQFERSCSAEVNCGNPLCFYRIIIRTNSVSLDRPRVIVYKSKTESSLDKCGSR
jgi:hypothetical protein